MGIRLDTPWTLPALLLRAAFGDIQILFDWRMDSFALVAWVILLWHVAASGCCFCLSMLRRAVAAGALLIAALLHSACALGFCRRGAFFDWAALCGGKAWDGIGEIFQLFVDFSWVGLVVV